MSIETDQINSGYTRREFLQLAGITGLTILAAACQRPTNSTPSSRETTSNTSPASPEPGSDWVTHNSSYLTIRYPAGWKYINYSQPPNLNEGPQLSREGGSGYEDRIGIIKIQSLLPALLKPGVLSLTQDEFISDNSPFYKKEFRAQIQSNLKEEKVKIDSFDATMFSTRLEHPWLSDQKLTGNLYLETVNFIRNGNQWSISFFHNEDPQLAQKVLRDFKIKQ